mgnify:CR=1 FL=1
MTLSKILRRAWFGLKTLLGSRNYGYFIPARSARFRRNTESHSAYPLWEKRFEALGATQRHWLGVVDSYKIPLQAIDGTQQSAARWQQDWFPRLDAATLYAFIRHFKPRRIVEIGAGHSTRFAIQAIEDEGLQTALTVIDPEPRKEFPTAPNLNWITEPLQDISPEIWNEIDAGDMVSIDSSHVLMPGSDVDLLLNVILPSLPAGAMIQVHDIFLPDDYPTEWRWRGYNEQSGWAPFLAGPATELVISSRYVTTRMVPAFRQTAIASLPLLAGARETSVWFRIAESKEPTDEKT